MMRLFDLSGRTALVTGSAQGLGNAIARGLGDAGATVVLGDVVVDRLNAAVARLRADAVDDDHERRLARGLRPKTGTNPNAAIMSNA